MSDNGHMSPVMPVHGATSANRLSGSPQLVIIMSPITVLELGTHRPSVKTAGTSSCFFFLEIVCGTKPSNKQAGREPDGPKHSNRMAVR